MIFGTVKLCRSEPVLSREIDIVFDAKATLFGTVDHEEPTERPESLSTDGIFTFLFEENDFASGCSQFVSGDKSRQSCSNDYRISIGHPRFLSPKRRLMKAS